MTTTFAPFTTANAVSSIDLLRPSSQPPSADETLDVTIHAWTQAQQADITPTPHGATDAEHFLHSKRTALQHAAQAIYLAAVEIADPEQRDSLLQHLHRQHSTLTQWAAHQTAPTLTEMARTALRREYNARFGFPIITAQAVRWIAQATAEIPSSKSEPATATSQANSSTTTWTSSPPTPIRPARRTDTASQWHPYPASKY